MPRALLLLFGLLSGCTCGSTVVPPPVAPAARPVEGPGGSFELAGVRYLEHLTGGARPDERVPMIIALHGMGADPDDMLELFQAYPHRARLVLPFGHPRGGKFAWFEGLGRDAPAAEVTRETQRLADFIAALLVARPTVGKPVITGFSQGGMLSFALAVTHPDAISAAVPISGMLPPSLYPLAQSERSIARPPVIAFHGGADLAVPTASARASVALLQSAGYAAELREYAGVAHHTTPAEIVELFERLAAAAPER
jgi:phospholipase/carboxylesterase